MLTGAARLAGVIGWPIAHSRSPRLHGHWLERYGIDGAYLPLPVEPARLAEALTGLQAVGFRGVNVTVPYKEAVLPFCQSLSEAAAAIGAVNTLSFTEQGLHGDNSDAFGFIENLRAKQPNWALTGKTCLVLGAGGSARAVVWGLLNAGAGKVIITNRTQARAESLAEALDASVCPWEARCDQLSGCDLLVNSTSLGMAGQAPLEIDLRALPDNALVADLVYAPLETDLLQAAASRGLGVVAGIGMLLHQARPGFAAWFGHEPVVDAVLEAAVLADAG
ncbi:MAG: shikimate dehydrogenase [Pseudomonadota bacterium]